MPKYLVEIVVEVEAADSDEAYRMAHAASSDIDVRDGMKVERLSEPSETE